MLVQATVDAHSGRTTQDQVDDLIARTIYSSNPVASDFRVREALGADVESLGDGLGVKRPGGWQRERGGDRRGVRHHDPHEALGAEGASRGWKEHASGLSRDDDLLVGRDHPA